MKKTLGMLIVLALAALPAAAQTVTIDYAHDYDFKTVKTFQFVESSDSKASDPLMDGRIKDAIVNQLVQAGLTQVEADPNIYVTYGITTQKNAVYNTTSMGYGGFGLGWRGWGMGGMGSSTTTESTYTEGTLIIDAYDAGDKKLVWRGTGTVTVKAKPEKVTEQINKIVTKLGEKWQKILAGMGE
jgi:hypothetical protein